MSFAFVSEATSEWPPWPLQPWCPSALRCITTFSNKGAWTSLTFSHTYLSSWFSAELSDPVISLSLLPQLLHPSLSDSSLISQSPAPTSIHSPISVFIWPAHLHQQLPTPSWWFLCCLAGCCASVLSLRSFVLWYHLRTAMLTEYSMQELWRFSHVYLSRRTEVITKIRGQALEFSLKKKNIILERLVKICKMYFILMC